MKIYSPVVAQPFQAAMGFQRNLKRRWSSYLHTRSTSSPSIVHYSIVHGKYYRGSASYITIYRAVDASWVSDRWLYFTTIRMRAFASATVPAKTHHRRFFLHTHHISTLRLPSPCLSYFHFYSSPSSYASFVASIFTTFSCQHLLSQSSFHARTCLGAVCRPNFWNLMFGWDLGRMFQNWGVGERRHL